MSGPPVDTSLQSNDDINQSLDDPVPACIHGLDDQVHLCDVEGMDDTVVASVESLNDAVLFAVDADDETDKIMLTTDHNDIVPVLCCVARDSSEELDTIVDASEV